MDTIYRVAAGPADGNGRRLVYVYDVDDVELARAEFSDDELDAPTDDAVLAVWINHVLVYALTTERRDVCGDCGNAVVYGWPHAPDCDYRD